MEKTKKHGGISLNNDLIFVKLGGSIITEKDSPFTVRYDELKRIVKEIKDAIDTNPNLKLVIGHGGGSFSHPVANFYKTHNGFIQENSRRGYVLCQSASSTLNKIVVDMMIQYNLNAVSIQPSACCVSDNGKISYFFMDNIQFFVKNGVIPVLYGDCVPDKTRGCAIISTEQLLSYLSVHMMKPMRFLVFGFVDGVYTGDPQINKDVEMISKINLQNYGYIEPYLTGSYSIDVTGGMLSKVREMLNLAKLGIQCEIISGLKHGYIKRALSRETGLGTVIAEK